MFTLDGSQLWISVDNDPPVANMSFIADVDKHAVLASMNATSKKPGDFMVRVVGEPTPTPPELKPSSIDVGGDETIMVFTYPGEVMSMGARMLKWDGSFVEQNVTRDGQNLVVRVRDEGVLNVFIVTPSSEIIGTSIRLETGLRTIYKSLLTNYTVLKTSSDEMRRQLNSLLEENEKLRIQVRDSGYAISVLQKQVWGLMENITRQNQQIAELNRSIEKLRLENTVLLALLIVSVAVPPIVLTVKKLRMRK
jgi:regulator of replication initiation timing